LGQIGAKRARLCEPLVHCGMPSQRAVGDEGT